MCVENQLSMFDDIEDDIESPNNLTADQISDYAIQENQQESMTPTKSFAWHNLVGSERFFFESIKGYDKLSEYAQRLVRFYIQGDVRIPDSPTFYRDIDGFISAKALAYFMGFHDTRPLRQHNAEIDEKTELVVWGSQYGYKLCATDKDIDKAVVFSIRPALTALKHVMYKSKNRNLNKMLHGFIENQNKKIESIPQGQKQYDLDDDMNLREVNHFVKENNEREKLEIKGE